MHASWEHRRTARHGLGDVIRSIEAHLTGVGEPTVPEAYLPAAHTYVLVLFDGLGVHQLSHQRAGSLRRSLTATIHAPFPTTTTVSMATVATGREPADHGVLGHLLWIPEIGEVVNTLKWVTPQGRRLSHDTSGFLPAPNLWERLGLQGVEPITVQPAGFADSPLTAALYRGCAFDGIHTEDDLVENTATLARVPQRLIFTYLPHVDFAAHVSGQDSDEYAQAVGTVDRVWTLLRQRLPDGAVLIGTSDHGHIDYSTEDKLLIRDRAYDDLLFYGDSRALMVRGEPDRIAQLSRETGADLATGSELETLFGPVADRYRDRVPDAVLLAPPGRLLLPRGFDKRLIGYHGGLEPHEVEIPLLVG